jgi:hypothetical protein
VSVDIQEKGSIELSDPDVNVRDPVKSELSTSSTAVSSPSSSSIVPAQVPKRLKVGSSGALASLSESQLNNVRDKNK